MLLRLQTELLGSRGLILTAPDASNSLYHVRSRVFIPCNNIPEDPATGSAHCALVPFWLGTDAHRRLIGGLKDGEMTLRCRQDSTRGGEMEVEWQREKGRCLIRAAAVLVSQDSLDVAEALAV